MWFSCGPGIIRLELFVFVFRVRIWGWSLHGFYCSLIVRSNIYIGQVSMVLLGNVYICLSICFYLCLDLTSSTDVACVKE